MTKKTLEEYQIQEIARTDFVRRGEYDIHVTQKNTTVTTQDAKATSWGH